MSLKLVSKPVNLGLGVTVFKVGSVFMFDDGMVGSLTSRGRLAMVHPSGMTLAAQYHPKLSDYAARHKIDTMIEPDEDYSEVTVVFDLGEMERLAA